jgi:hypothetical protein
MLGTTCRFASTWTQHALAVENIAHIELRSIYSPGTGALAETEPPNDWRAR